MPAQCFLRGPIPGYISGDINEDFNSLPMDCYLDVVGGLVPLRFEEGRPEAVRDRVDGTGHQQYY
jgi:hypothetical protein